jgi:hypothetical protein
MTHSYQLYYPIALERCFDQVKTDSQPAMKNKLDLCVLSPVFMKLVRVRKFGLHVAQNSDLLAGGVGVSQGKAVRPHTHLSTAQYCHRPHTSTLGHTHISAQLSTATAHTPAH